MQAAAFNRDNWISRSAASTGLGTLVEDRTESTRLDSIARGMVEQQRFDLFWTGVKKVVESQSLRKPSQRFHDLNEELARQNRKIRRQFVIRPEHPLKIVWDLLMFGLTMYSVVMTFYYIGFNVSPSDAVSNFNLLVTGLFGLDILVSFLTGYINQETGQFISDRRLIALNYLKLWFWIDIIATIPFDTILPIFLGNISNITAIRMIRFVRIFRIIKIYKILDKDGFLSKLKLNPQLLQLIILLVELFFIAHVFACFWHYLALPYNADGYFENWITKFGYDKAIESDRYVTSLYYIIVTMLTIGYGDIYPTNQLERIYAIFTMVTGVIVFSTLMSKVASLFDKLNPNAKLQAGKMLELKAFLIEIQLPRHLREKAKAQYEYYFDKKAALADVGLSDLAKPMLMNLLNDLYKDDFHGIGLFREMNSQLFLFQILQYWQPSFALAGDVFYEQGDIFKKLIFIKTGRVRISHLIRTVERSTATGGSSKNSEKEFTNSLSEVGSNKVSGTLTVIGGLYDGEYFGEMEYLKNLTSLAHYSAVINCTLFSVDHAVISSFLSTEEVLGHQLNLIFMKRHLAMTRLLHQTKPVKLRKAYVRLDHLNDGKKEKLIGWINRLIYLNGRKAHCDRYIQDFILIAKKDADEALKIMSEGTDDVANMSELSYDDVDETEEEKPMIRVLIPNPLLQINNVLSSQKDQFNRSVANNESTFPMIVVELPLSTLKENYLLHPLGTFKTIWDLTIAFVVVITILIIPIQIAFLYDAFPGTDTFNYIVVCFLGVDIILTFRTIVESPENDAYIISDRLIARNYLKGWFIIDLISTLPFNVLSFFTNIDKSTLILFQLLKFLRFLWLFKLKRIRKTTEAMEEYFGISPALIRLIGLICKVYFIVHIMACLWWGVSKAISPDPWFQYSGPDGFFYGRLTNVHVSAQYLMSLYFTFTTMSTVGYGDIHQVNPAERTLAIPYLIVSAAVFGFMLASISSIINSSSESESIATDKIALITEYLHERKCSNDLTDQIIYYFQRHLKEDTGYNVDEITNNLPDSLSTEIWLMFYQKKLSKVLFLQFVKNKSIQMHLFRLLKPVFYESNCYVCHQNEEQENNIYFLISGYARVFRLLRNRSVEARRSAQSWRSLRDGWRHFSTRKVNLPIERNDIRSGEDKDELRRKEANNEYDDEEKDGNEVDEDSSETEGQEEEEKEKDDTADDENEETTVKRINSFDFTSIYPKSKNYIPINTLLQSENEESPVNVIKSNKRNSNFTTPRQSPNDSTPSRASIVQRSRVFRCTKRSVTAKRSEIKIDDDLNAFAKRKGKPFLDMSAVEFLHLGYKFLVDLQSGDFFGYSQFMKDLETVTKGKANPLSTSKIIPRGKRNAYSVKTALETSLLVLEKQDLMNLLKSEPFIAMELQMSLAKSICIQSNQMTHHIHQITRKNFAHYIKRCYFKKKSSRLSQRLSSSSSLTSSNYHQTMKKNRRLFRRELNKEKETNTNINAMNPAAPSHIVTLNPIQRVARFLSIQYRIVRKVTTNYAQQPEDDEYEGDWIAPPPSSVVVNDLRRFGERAISRAMSSSSSSSKPTLKRMRKSYSFNDLELLKSNEYSMKNSIIRTEYANEKKEEEDGRIISSPPSLTGILKTGRSPRSGGCVENRIMRKKAVTFHLEEIVTPSLEEEGTEMIDIAFDKDFLEGKEGISSNSQLSHSYEEFSQAAALGVDDFMSHDFSEEEGDVSINHTENDTIQHRQMEYRPRSLSFPFTGYKQWKLFQTKKCDL